MVVAVPDPASSAPNERPVGVRVRLRALIAGAILIVLSAFAGVYGYTVVQALLWSQQSLKCGPLVILFVLVLVNRALARWRRAATFNRAELLLIPPVDQPKPLKAIAGLRLRGHRDMQRLMHRV